MSAAPRLRVIEPSDDHRAQAAAALSFYFRGCPDDATVIINRAEQGGFRTYRIEIDNLRFVPEQYAGRMDGVATYTRMTVIKRDQILPAGSRGTEADSYGAAVLWVDLDPEKGSDESYASFQDRVLGELQRFRIPPSMIETSGRGLHAFWKIPFTEDWQRIKRINKWLSLQFNADSTFDAARVMRLPGTYNEKPGVDEWARILVPDTGVAYTLEDFDESDFTPEEIRITERNLTPSDLPPDFADTIKRMSPILWKRIFSEETALEAGAALGTGTKASRVDRSANDWYITTTLLRRGISPSQVFSVLTHPTWFSGHKFREDFRESYVKHTINEALQVVEARTELLSAFSDKAPPPAVIGQMILELEQLMYHRQNWYRYNEARGVYEPWENGLRRLIQVLLDDKWSTYAESAVPAWLKTNREELEVPAHGLVNCTSGMLSWKHPRLPNGEIDRRVEVLPHSPGYRSIHQIDAEWDPDVDCSEVDAFVASVIPAAEIPIWWQFAGYCLYPEFPYRILFVLVGRFRSGKSTLAKGLVEMLGKPNVSTVSLAELSGDGNQFTVARFISKMLNVDYDSPSEVKGGWDGHLLKKIGDGSEMSSERKHRESEENVVNNCKHMFIMNDFPLFSGADEGVYDRFRILKMRTDVPRFTDDNARTIPNAEAVLLSKQKNRNAWLKRSIEGLQELFVNNGFVETASMKEQKDQFRKDSDAAYRFWASYCSPGEGHRASALEAYRRYQEYAREHGHRNPLTSTKFQRRTHELIEAGLLPGLEMIETDRKWWVGYRIPSRPMITINDSR